MTVNIGGHTTPDSLRWGTTSGSHIMGTLKFGSSTSQNVTTFRNPVNLYGANRTINVDDNPASSADYTIMQGAITNSTGTAGLIKTGDGLLCLTSTSNSYNGSTTIVGGVLQVNLPTNSFLSLEGGVYESTTGGTFSRPLGSSGSTFRYTGNGGGFSTTSSPFTINVGGNGATLAWGDNVGTQIVGTMGFGSVRSTSSVTFVNGVNLNGGARTIRVEDNPSSTADFTVLSGAITDTLGGGSLSKAGRGNALSQRHGVERLFRRDHDRRHAGSRQDRRRHRHSGQRHACRDRLRRQHDSATQRRQPDRLVLRHDVQHPAGQLAFGPQRPRADALRD